MNKKLSTDPRSIRARSALNNALNDLLKEKPFREITITDIAKRAGFARHTFYNHYEAKEDLLNNLIDSILDEVFSEIGRWDINDENLHEYNEFGKKFFEIWQSHAKLTETFTSVDIDCLLINRFKIHFTNYYHEFGNQEITGMGIEMARYLICFNAYSFVGILRQWFQDGMMYSPDVMGQFLGHFAGVSQVNKAIEKFKDIIR